VYRKLPYDPVRDFTPVTPLFRNSFFIVVGAARPTRMSATSLPRRRLRRASWPMPPSLSAVPATSAR